MGTSTGQHPRRSTLETNFPALGTDVEGSTIIGRAPYAGVIESATVIPVADITGAATNHRKYEVVNKGQAGDGTGVLAALAFASGVNATDFNETSLTLATLTVGTERDVAAGDILALVSTAPGTGIADPGGRVLVKLSRD